MATKINTMPNNLDAEMALLGCILIDNEILPDLIERLAEEDFYVDAHKYIILAIKAVFNNKKPVDLVTLSDELDVEGNLEKAGGITYITELIQFTPSAANYEHYLKIVKRDSLNRKLIRASKNIIENSMKSEDEIGSLEYAEKAIYDISKESQNSALLGMKEGDIVNAVIHKFENISQNRNAYRGVETGFSHLDRMTNGLQRSDLIVLAARPGMGKTSLSMNIVEHAAMVKGCTCAVFSLEMPREQIVTRLLCSYANVSMEKALSGRLNDDEWQKIFRASDKLANSPIYIDDSSRVTPAEILSKCRRLNTMGKNKLDLIMIDYIQLMSSGANGSSSQENRQQEIASITRDLKIMAKELNVPIIALSQLRRIQTKEPQLSDLRESGAIEQDADIVMFINRPDAVATKEELDSGKVVKGAAELIVAKHRNGSQGRVQLRFIGECTKFVDEDDQNRKDEPPEYGYAKKKSQAEDEEGESYQYDREPPNFDDGEAPF